MGHNLTFSQMPLDRASNLRKDSVWINNKIISDDSCFYFFWRGKFLYVEVINTELEIFIYSKKNDGSRLSKAFDIIESLNNTHLIFLGLEDGTAHFVYDLSTMNEVSLKEWLLTLTNNKVKFIDFRNSLSLLTSVQASILSYAKALIHWSNSALYCGFCGNITQSMDGGHRRKCLNKQCEKEQFPRTDPAVIMLVEYQPKDGPAQCLLAEHHRTPAQVYSTLAGFVDPGESLTESVRREVLEEVGIAVTEVKYIDSQPWPFPNSLMLGFIARAKNTEITLEEEELRSAAWFTAQQLAECHEWGDDVDGIKLPRKESIARLLIDLWCAQQKSKESA